MQSNVHREICAEIQDVFAGNTQFVLNTGSRGDGEWAWIEKNYRANLRPALEKHSDFSGLFAELEGFPLSPLSYGMVTFSEEEGLRHSDELGLLRTGAWKDFFLLKRLLKKGGHLAGGEWPALLKVNLPGIEQNGILDDCFRHTYFSSLLLELAGSGGRGGQSNSTEIIEVGGGYGGLALQIERLKLSGHQIRHTIIDLPESLLLSYWFLRMQGLPVDVVLDESGFDGVAPSGVVLVPDYLFTNIPWEADLLFNSRSFSEMTRETSSKYLKHTDEFWRPASIVLEATGYDLFPNSIRHKERLVRDLINDLPSYRLDSSDWSPWQGGGGRYFEYVLGRK